MSIALSIYIITRQYPKYLFFTLSNHRWRGLPLSRFFVWFLIGKFRCRLPPARSNRFALSMNILILNMLYNLFVSAFYRLSYSPFQFRTDRWIIRKFFFFQWYRLTCLHYYRSIFKYCIEYIYIYFVLICWNFRIKRIKKLQVTFV